jgi:pimeloyl-ACP methyl ester carboxylesterase
MTRRMWTLALAALALAGVTTAPASAAGTASCAPVAMTVPAQLGVAGSVSVPVPAEDWTIRGKLCIPPGATTVQLLQSGATFGSEYWDLGYQPDTYSYVRHANQAGYATLNIDRLGIGSSSHPTPALVTTETEANIAHLLVERLRSGAFGTRFTSVVSVGHSYGSVIALAEAGTYRDVDALVVTGLSHAISPDFVTKFTTSLAPAAAVDPARFGGLSPDYLTTRPGTRPGAFYLTSNVDPAVVARDEATKQTFTLTEDATFPTVLPDTLGITAPVDVVVGDRDALFCGVLDDCSSVLGLAAAERLFYPAARTFTYTSIPDAGHALNLQRNAPTTYATIESWIGANLG